MPNEDQRWSLDRRVPLWAIISLLFTLVGAGSGVAMSTGRLTHRIEMLEERSRTAIHDHDLLVGMRADLNAVMVSLDRIEKRQFEEHKQ